MIYNVRFAAEAFSDQASIVDYLANSLQSSDAARHFLGELENLVFELEQSPGVFPFCREPRLKALGYQKFLFMNYVALFRVEGETVFVSHIFHQSQDYAKLV